ncbi:MAG: hypothetical protein ONB05_07135 [candidate division KSB1 bacterium]|nr:hypothetical protein [candidate division KSB1 bacterium]
MDLFDTNLFLIDRFFPGDKRHQDSSNALALVASREVGVGVFTWLEFLGIASFNVSPEELVKLSWDFETRYRIKILYPLDLHVPAEDWLRDSYIYGMLVLFEKKITLGDAALLLKFFRLRNSMR